MRRNNSFLICPVCAMKISTTEEPYVCYCGYKYPIQGEITQQKLYDEDFDDTCNRIKLEFGEEKYELWRKAYDKATEEENKKDPSKCLFRYAKRLMEEKNVNLDDKYYQ